MSHNERESLSVCRILRTLKANLRIFGNETLINGKDQVTIRTQRDENQKIQVFISSNRGNAEELYSSQVNYVSINDDGKVDLDKTLGSEAHDELLAFLRAQGFRESES